MAEHFLTKTRIDLGRCIQVSGAGAVDKHAELYALLSAKAGPDAAKLFAEPLVSKGNDQAASTISWYSDRAGQGVPFAKLDAAGQQEVGDVLAVRLRGQGDDATSAGRSDRGHHLDPGELSHWHALAPRSQARVE